MQYPLNGVVCNGAQIQGLQVFPTAYTKQTQENRVGDLRTLCGTFTHVYLQAACAGDIFRHLMSHKVVLIRQPYTISIKGVLHPRPIFLTVCAFSQKLQHIGDK